MTAAASVALGGRDIGPGQDLFLIVGPCVLEDPDEYIRFNLGHLGRRRTAAVDAFQAAGLDVTAPRGTLYLWFPVPGPEKSEDFCRRLLIDSGVVLLPGSAMGPGGEGFVRASLAIHEDRWEEAGRRIQEAL